MTLLWTDGLLELTESERVLEKKISLDLACTQYGPVRVVCRITRRTRIVRETK